MTTSEIDEEGVREQSLKSAIDLALRQALPYAEYDREGLRETPDRWAKAFQHWTSGYYQRPEDLLKTFEDGAAGCDELIFQRSIPVWSLCEHHLAPFFGVAHVGYIPDGRIVGLSKLARVVDVFAKRLQVQERLTNQVAELLTSTLAPLGVGVILECRHSCMESRGIQRAGVVTVTSSLSGVFRTDPSARAEFLGLARGLGTNP